MAESSLRNEKRDASRRHKIENKADTLTIHLGSCQEGITMASSGESGEGQSDDYGGENARELLVIVLDVTPWAWGEREMRRAVQDEQRRKAGRRSMGPANLEEAIAATLALGTAVGCLDRQNCLSVVGVSGSETAVMYPRKSSLGHAVHDAPEWSGSKIDARALDEGIRLGVAELAARSTARTQPTSSSPSKQQQSPPSSQTEEGAAIAAGMSLALCVINRFMVASNGGVSALASESLLKRREDEGVVAMLAAAGGEKQGKARHNSAGMLSPRILVIQATPDRPSDYNAMMNCAFACSSHHEDQQESKAHHHESMEDANRIVVDGCFLPSIINGRASRSLVLEQVCDRTGGVFLAPSGAAQVGGGLTQVLCTVFLPPRSVRRHLHLPVLTEVDFRARCFATGESVEMAHVCNQCLSIFRDRPTDSICPTCGASGASLAAADPKEASLSEEQRSAKRQKHS